MSAENCPIEEGDIEESPPPLPRFPCPGCGRMTTKHIFAKYDGKCNNCYYCYEPTQEEIKAELVEIQKEWGDENEHRVEGYQNRGVVFKEQGLSMSRKRKKAE